MTDDDLEELGLLADKLDNGVAATALPIEPRLHVEGMKGIMEEVRDGLKAFLASKGYNPWNEHPL